MPAQIFIIISKEELYNELMKNSYLKAKLEKFYDI